MEEFMSNNQKRKLEDKVRKYREYEVECNNEWCYRDECECNIVYGVRIG